MDYPFDAYTYTLVDDDAHKVIDPDVAMPEFIALNGLDPSEVEDICRAHEDRRPWSFGGGAAPAFTLLRSRKVTP